MSQFCEAIRFHIIPDVWKYSQNTFSSCGALSRFGCIRLHVTLYLWSSRLLWPQDPYCSGLSCPLPGDVPDPGIEPVSCIGRHILYHECHLGSPTTLNLQWGGTGQEWDTRSREASFVPSQERGNMIITGWILFKDFTFFLKMSVLSYLI